MSSVVNGCAYQLLNSIHLLNYKQIDVRTIKPLIKRGFEIDDIESIDVFKNRCTLLSNRYTCLWDIPITKTTRWTRYGTVNNHVIKYKPGVFRSVNGVEEHELTTDPKDPLIQAILNTDVNGDVITSINVSNLFNDIVIVTFRGYQVTTTHDTVLLFIPVLRKEINTFCARFEIKDLYGCLGHKGA